ncbi:hypothetical protein [Streptomyces tibetensis]|uniref:hypothetical protein n=1 Tax=Streptomyces tibetensis TaxID=2382123 RepID=UPI0033CCDB46
MPHWAIGEVDAPYAMTAKSQTIWNGTGKEQFDLGWSLLGSVDAGNAHAQTSLGTSGDVRVRELAPRCDDIAGGSIKTGCACPDRPRGRHRRRTPVGDRPNRRP